MTRRVEGERIYLRAIRIEDVTDRYLAWMNDPEITRYLETRFAPVTLDDLRAFVTAREQDPDNWFFAIVLKAGDRHIGNIKLGPVNRHHRYADVGLVVGERDCWGQGYATDAIALVTRFGFEELDLNKITAGCYAANVGSLKAFLRAGWHHEATRRAQFFCDGAYQDQLLLARFNDGTRASAPR